MIKPSLKEIRKIQKTGDFDVIPVCIELLSDIKTPIEVLKNLLNVSNNCYLLESVAENEKWGRYTFLGYSPVFGVTCKDSVMQIGDEKLHTNDPSDVLRDLLSDYKSPEIEGMPPFTGGFVGYFAYDHIKYAEKKLKLSSLDNEGFMDLDLMLFDKVIAFDNFRQKIFLIANIQTKDLEAGYGRAKEDLLEMKNLILSGLPKRKTSGKLLSEITPLFGKDKFCEMVKKAKKHIYEGDIFQVVLSNVFSAGFEGSLLDTYRILRTLNPSPYMFYFSGTQIEFAGASPETLVKLEGRDLYTYPLAGTRARGKNEEEDLTLEKELLSDPKEIAEHNMLVDLGRNDLGKISKIGSVRVEKFHSIEKFSHVMHLASTVRGEIREDMDALDAVEAVLPAGTLSGAPKIRACEIIDKLEGNRRGIYGGAIGYIDFKGNMDTCIAIRIAYKKNGKVFIRSGAGIVADSVPDKEYKECMDKAAVVMKALKLAEEIDGYASTDR